MRKAWTSGWHRRSPMGDGWIATMQHLARENRMYVVGVNPVLHVDHIPADFPDRERLVPASFVDEHGPGSSPGTP